MNLLARCRLFLLRALFIVAIFNLSQEGTKCSSALTNPHFCMRRVLLLFSISLMRLQSSLARIFQS
jgi:hypothetical protein